MKNTVLALFLFVSFAYFELVYGQQNEAYKEYEKYYEEQEEEQEKKSKDHEQRRDEQLKDKQQEEPLQPSVLPEADESQQNNARPENNSSSAPSPPPIQGSHKPGLFVRSLLVVGKLEKTLTVEGLPDFEDKDDGFPAFEAALSVGGVVIPNLAIHGGLDFAVIGNLRGVDDDDNNESPHSNYSHLSLGLTYYIMPANIYIAYDIRSLLYGYRYRNVDDKGRVTSEGIQKSDGLGYRFVVGKEWFVNSNYGIGIALSYSHTPTKHEDKNVEYPAAGCSICDSSESNSTLNEEVNILGIAFSTTFN